MSPPTTCPPIINYDILKDNGRCRFLVEITWDGVSGPPPACDGTVTKVQLSNSGSRIWYAHLPSAKGGPAVYQIPPGTGVPTPVQTTSRAILSAAGFDTKADIQTALDLNETPPQAGERLLN